MGGNHAPRPAGSNSDGWGTQGQSTMMDGEPSGQATRMDGNPAGNQLRWMGNLRAIYLYGWGNLRAIYLYGWGTHGQATCMDGEKTEAVVTRREKTTEGWRPWRRDGGRRHRDGGDYSLGKTGMGRAGS